MFKVLIIISLLVFIILLGYQKISQEAPEEPLSPNLNTSSQTPSPTPITIELPTPPEVKIIPNQYHIFQSFNNCGPASLSMALSYFNINVSQSELGSQLRPYQVAGGDNDDKSVTLEELAKKAQEYGLIAYHRPNGNFEIIKQFITLDIPLLTRTWTKPLEDIGHFRVIKGYDQASGEIIQDDSLQGKNLRYKISDFDLLWKKFNYEYLVLVPKEKQKEAEAILGKNLDEEFAWQEAVKLSEAELTTDSNDFYARFNLSVSLFHLKQYEKSIQEFERVENKLPFRTLWYQIEPMQSYFKMGNYDKVLQITEKVLNNQNRAFSELYLLRGESYLKMNEKEKAKNEFEKAVLYNENLEDAKLALEKVTE